jgi:ATP-independent RNA helicase DbpA
MNFSTLSLTPEMVANLKQHGYSIMTPIQEASLPSILEKHDVLAQAKTGSGKTAAFGIGVLHHLDVKKFRVQSLVLCPTRELADQVAKEMRRIARFAHNIKILTLSGGVPFKPQLHSLKHQAHIVVGTPGRVLRHLEEGSLSLNNLEMLVLDEADRMLDMGFLEEIEKVISYAPKQRQTLLFSATYPEAILELSQTIQNDAKNIQTTDSEEKLETLRNILADQNPSQALVFVNTKLQAQATANYLVEQGIDALALHGDLEQYERNDVFVQFSNLSCVVMVSTDLAARGLDIEGLPLVINYDLPQDSAVYTHRIGRTGRAGEKGKACSIYSEDDAYLIETYERREAIFNAPLNRAKETFTLSAPNVTLVIEGGKKDKLRIGDILGALTSEGGIAGSAVGKIERYDRQSYVAIAREAIDTAYNLLDRGKIKGKSFPVWVLE